MKGRLVPVLGALGVLLTGVVWATAANDNDSPAQQPVMAQAGDVKAQIKTAITHAGFAAGGSTLSYVEQHLGHALNCIEGTKGRNFNQSWGHVCQGQGNGIRVDLKSAPGGVDVMLVAEAADVLAVAGVKSKNLNEARNAAKGVAALLNVISDNLK
jgi:hypothetical protein